MKTLVTLEKKYYEWLRETAFRKGISQSEVIEKLIEKAMKKNT